MLKDLVVALSLSNLWFINAWRFLLKPSAFYIYHQKNPNPLGDYLGIIFDVLLLAGVFFVGITLARRCQRTWIWKCASVFFVLVFSTTLYSLLTQIEIQTVRPFAIPWLGNEKLFRQLFYSIPISICIFLILIAFLRMEKTVRFAVKSILILAPFVLITFSQATLSAVNNRYAGDAPRTAPLTKKGDKARPRVLWLVFDELDFRIAFQDRPATVKLPELDRLIKQSLFAQNAYPPAGETFLTMPALIGGKLISEAHRKGKDELMIKFGDSEEAVAWSRQPNVFSRAREEGLNTALFGWYHPYCRILTQSLTRCGWEDGLYPKDAQGVTPYMYEHARRVALTPPLATLIFPKVNDRWAPVRKKHLSDYSNIYKDAVRAAGDPELELVMVHWPIPHHPNIYDRFESAISVSANRSYLDNLELVDRTIGDLRKAMESNNTWNDTAVLVTSDHWWRVESVWKKRLVLTSEDQAAFAGLEDRRIPFILKLPEGGSQGGTIYSEPFNSVLTQDLVLAILRGELSGAKDASDWLDRNRSIGRSPYDERSFR